MGSHPFVMHGGVAVTLCPTCRADLAALTEQRDALAGIETEAATRRAEITDQIDWILDGNHLVDAHIEVTR